MKKLIALLLALVMVVGLVACAPAAPEDTTGTEPNNATSGKEDTKATEPVVTESETPLQIHWDQGIGVDTLFENPCQNSSLMYASHMIWQGAAQWNDETKEFELRLADDWGHNEDNTLYWVSFRDDAKWHDGEPVTIEDLKWTVDQCLLNSGLTSGHKNFEYVEGYAACRNGEADTLSGCYIEGDKLYFKMTTSVADWRGWSLLILPAHCFEGVDWADINTSDYFKKPIGCGPYMITEVKFPDYFKMTRFDGYYGAPAGIKNVVCKNYSSAGSDALTAALINEELDIGTRTITTDASIANMIMEQNSDIKSHSMVTFNMRCWVFNLGQRTDGKVKADLQKKEVRQAIALIIDEDVMAELALAEPSRTLCAAFGAEYYNGYDNEPSKDTAKAKKMLEDAGFDFTQVIDLVAYYTDQTTTDLLELLKQDFAEAGVTISYRIITENAGEELYTLSNFDLVYGQAGASEVASSKAIEQLGSNRTYTFICQEGDDMYKYLADRYDDLLAQYGAATAYSEEKIALGQKLQQMNYEDAIIIPAYANPSIMVYNSARVYVPDEDFDRYDSCYHFDQWKMLV